MTTNRASKTVTAQPDQQTHAAAWCDPTMCQAGDSNYVDRLHMFLGEHMGMSMPDRWVDADGTQVAAVVAVFVWQHVSAAAPTLGIWSEGGARASDAFEIKLTRDEFIALHAEMGRVIEATA